MKKIIIILFLFISNLAEAQTVHFITEGEIVFEKTINMHAVLKRSNEKANANVLAAVDQYKKTQPQFLVLKSNLSFSKTNSAYIPQPYYLGSSLNNFSFNPMYNQINKVYTNLLSDSTVIQKNIFDQYFLLKGKRQNIKWKITDETREIAGYLCRRANGLVNDSIYVVAFYTNKIPVPVGPESFYGLPGMILGVAVPYENITWFALEVKEKKYDKDLLVPPTKGKLITREELLETLRKSLQSSSSFIESMLTGYFL